MVEKSKISSNSEINEIISIQYEQEMQQEPKTLETLGRVDSSKIEESLGSSNVLELLTFLQEMNREEQRLVEAKKYLLEKQHDLKSKLVEEISKKKMAIDELRSEIPDLQDRCKKLGQALGIDPI